MKPHRRPRLLRLMGLTLAMLLALAPVAASWFNYRGAVTASAALTRGQLTALEGALRQEFHPWNPLPDSAELARFMADHPESGLRYIALLDRDGSVLASAGDRLGPPSVPGAGAPGLRDPAPIGDRIRAYTFRPATEPATAATDRGDRYGGRGRGGGTRFSPRENLVEFEPLLARTLISRAQRTLALTGVLAAVLATLVVVFWRVSERLQQARLRLVEQHRLTQLGEMSAVLAHEIRNPLASLKGTAQLLAERFEPDSRERSRAERIVYEAVRLEGLTSDLLDFARGAPATLRPADPAEVARSAADSVAEGGFELQLDHAPASWAMDPGRVGQALVNVLQNARQASPDRAPVLRVAEEGGELLLEVRDFGPGLPPGSEGRLFDPFFTTRTQGTGLGLAVARRVAELHGGRIAAANHPAGGAVFRIHLP